MVAFTNLVSSVAAAALLLAGSNYQALAAQLTRVNYPNNATSKAEMYVHSQLYPFSRCVELTT